LPTFEATGWNKPLGTNWTSDADLAEIVHDEVYGATFLHFGWQVGKSERRADIVSKVATTDRAVDLIGNNGQPTPISAAERALYLKATLLIPTDGIVKETSDKISGGAKSDLEKAQAIYQWLVANTERIAATPGCGSGDVRAMLMSGRLGGKCADINGLFVGLARAAGLPARDIYGVRVGPSRFGYKSLGVATTNITRAQHCRSDVYLDGYGWTPMDAADVRKVMLEEPPTHLGLDDPKVAAARRALMGAWEGNWVGYNAAHDIALPGATAAPASFLMYPQGEVGGQRLDCLDAQNFRYSTEAREIAT
jgi:transglutaminase-like putative cysteine protease